MMGEMEIPDELIDQLLGEYTGPEQLTGPDGLINQLRRRLIERAAGAELEQHLGYPAGAEAPEGRPNGRNGTTSKTLRTVDGPVTVELPRDRDASFEPRIVPKHTRSFDGFDEQILALYAGGMTTREIQRHLRELYGVDVSDWLISEVTASIQVDVRALQTRPHGELYAPVFPLSVNQTCIVHLVRQSLRYLSWRERRNCAGELRRIYTAADADQARQVLDELTAAWSESKTRTAALQVWERAWERVIPFLAFPDEIRRIVYTTNTVESLHMQIRKTIKTRGHFPNDDAALRLIWLAIMRAKTNWRTCYNWTHAKAVLRIHFGDRIPDNT